MTRQVVLQLRHAGRRTACRRACAATSSCWTPARSCLPSARVRPRVARSVRSSGRAIRMTSVLHSAPAAPMLASFTIQATLSPLTDQQAGKYPLGPAPPISRRSRRDCPLRARCTDNQFRTVSRLENEAVLDRMQERLAKRPEVLNQRRETVEHPFGSIKQWMNQGAFLMRGLEKVRGEFSLTALAYNLRRVLNLVGFADLMTAVRR